MEKVTADLILEELAKRVENKSAQFDANFWIETAMKLNLLLGDEQDDLWTARQKVAQKKLDIFNSQEKRNVAAANLQVEASDEYKQMRIQEAKCDRIEEFIRIAKKMSDSARGY